MRMSWSLTSLSTYEQCPAKYKFRYVENVPVVQDPNSAAARGTEIHGTIEKFLRGELLALPTELNFYTAYLTNLRTKEIYPEHKVALNRNWEPVSWDADDRWYKGVLDLKALNGAGQTAPTEATVIDWKTGKIYPEHDDQKSIYSLATFAEHPSVQRVRAMHVYVDLGKNREITYDRQQMHQLRSSWDSRILRLEKEEEFIPNPSFKCRYCPFSRASGGPCKF